MVGEMETHPDLGEPRKSQHPRQILTHSVFTNDEKISNLLRLRNTFVTRLNAVYYVRKNETMMQLELMN